VGRPGRAVERLLGDATTDAIGSVCAQMLSLQQHHSWPVPTAFFVRDCEFFSSYFWLLPKVLETPTNQPHDCIVF
jgi:hypothetical protein